MAGYRDPPVETRFKPGVSGNPRGRPKGSVSFRADLEAELAESISQDSATYSKSRAIVKNVVAQAMLSDAKIALKVLEFCARFFPEPPENDRQTDPEQLLLEKLADRERQDAAAPSDDGGN